MKLNEDVMVKNTRFVLRAGAIVAITATFILILMALLNGVLGLINPADYAIHGIKEKTFSEYMNYV